MRWNAKEWLNLFTVASSTVHAGDQSAMDTIRQLRKEVFHTTMEALANGLYETPTGKQVTLTNVNEIVKKASIYQTPLDVNGIGEAQGETAVIVENIDCLLAAQRLLIQGYHPAVLNMANRRTPGGGVRGGAGAQEETLCRRTALYPTLLQFQTTPAPNAYPLDCNYGGIYSPQVPVLRAPESKGYEWLETPFITSFISVAGINRPDLTPSGYLTPPMVTGTKHKIRTIFRLGLLHHHDALVLGALGCGAFRNPPDHMAQLFKEVMAEPEFKNKFKLLFFAIIEDHNSRHTHNPLGNFLPFQQCFSHNQAIKEPIESLRERENQQILESLANVIKLVNEKCARCNSMYGCMGCEFDSLAGPFIPPIADAFLSFAQRHPPSLPHLKVLHQKLHSHVVKREEKFKE